MAAASSTFGGGRFPDCIHKDIVGDAVQLSGCYFAAFALEAERLVQFHCGPVGGKNFQLYSIKRPRETLLNCHRKELAANTSGPMILLHAHTKTADMLYPFERVRIDIAPTNHLS